MDEPHRRGRNEMLQIPHGSLDERTNFERKTTLRGSSGSRPSVVGSCIRWSVVPNAGRSSIREERPVWAMMVWETLISVSSFIHCARLSYRRAGEALFILHEAEKEREELSRRWLLSSPLVSSSNSPWVFFGNIVTKFVAWNRSELIAAKSKSRDYIAALHIISG